MRLLLLFAVAAIAAAQTPPAPDQPIPFSHKVHAGTAKVKCKMCHPGPAPGESMTIAPASLCMQCHSAIKTDSPSIQKLAAFAKSDREIKWTRIYEIPSYVNFSHKDHLTAGNQCEDCHGKVAERDQLFKEVRLTMGTCVDCHRTKKASIDCTYCHEDKGQ